MINILTNRRETLGSGSNLSQEKCYEVGHVNNGEKCPACSSGVLNLQVYNPDVSNGTVNLTILCCSFL